MLLLLLYALAVAVVCANPSGEELRPHELAHTHVLLDLQHQQLHITPEPPVLASVHVLYPGGGSTTKCPIHVQYDTLVTSFEEMRAKHALAQACIEIDQQALNTTHCYPLQGTKILLTGLSAGVHYMRVLVVDSKNDQDIDGSMHIVQASSEVAFTVLDEPEFEVYVSRQRQLQREKHQLPPPEHDDLLKWAQSHDDASQPRTIGSVDVFGSFTVAQEEPHEDMNQDPPLVVIGVKSSVIHGFAQRQSIRDSWAANASRHRSVQVFFLGCRSMLGSKYGVVSPPNEELKLAIETEKRIFQDLLTNELDCDDSYYLLTDKVKEFMHFATTKFPSAPYIMITDDDAYVRTHDLIDLILSHRWPPERLYAGHIMYGEDGNLVPPERDPGHKNYLSVDQYPLPELPPFTHGCNFVVSADCARFIGRNRHRLKGLGGLDDASIALWLLTMQVHPRNVVEFSNVDSGSCRESLVSYADLSPSAMRIAHANLKAKRPFCADFDRNTWRKASSDGSSAFKTGVRFSTFVQRSGDNRHTQVFVNVTSTSAGSDWWAFSYLPATDLLDDLLPNLCLRIKQHVFPAGFACAAFANGLRQHMLEVVSSGNPDRTIDSAHLALWIHNLRFVGAQPQVPPITVVYSREAKPVKSMIECLLISIYKHNPIRVVDELTFQEQQQAQRRALSPDVFLFSALDGGLCGSAWDPDCQQAAAKYVQQYGDKSSLIMVASESWAVSALDERVVLLSSVAHVARKKHVYLSMASMSFSERVIQSPMLLLSKPNQPSPSTFPRKFCAYMYARCDQPQREYMFDLLNAMESVDALGMCQGSARGMLRDRLSGRLSPLYNEKAVSIYTDYKFVIAFENSQQQPGYVTEKIVNAFLAGSIPIYLGHSDSVSQLFNPRSFIDCGRFATLKKCAERVMEVHQSVEQYEAMLSEPVIGNVTLFHELFSWHPDIPSSHLADSVAALL